MSDFEPWVGRGLAQKLRTKNRAVVRKVSTPRSADHERFRIRDRRGPSRSPFASMHQVARVACIAGSSDGRRRQTRRVNVNPIRRRSTPCGGAGEWAREG